MRRWLIPLLVVPAVVVAAGASRLQLDVDVFNLLPADSPMVEGLELYQRNFGSSLDLMLSVRTDDPDASERAAHELAEMLEAEGLASTVIWRSPLLDDPAALGELMAFLWFNQPPEAFTLLADRFLPENLDRRLEATFDRMATSLRPVEVALLSRDPYALTDLPEGASLPIPEGRGDFLQSADGTFRVLFAAPPFDRPNFWRYRSWVRRTSEAIHRWHLAHPADPPVAVRVTGNPAFVAEVGSGLMRDMELAAIGTMLLVAALFWMVHRRWTSLLWLIALLVLILAATVAVGGLVLGTLNGVSLGFAAILLGLAADYGLILYQEFVAEPQRPVKDLQRNIAPSILWASATTAGAFFMIARSSLPGMVQLGTLVGIGIVLAAAVMLLAYLPPLAAGSFDRGTGTSTASALAMPGPRSTWWITVLAVGVSAAVLAVQRPTVDYGTEDLGPRSARARAALQEIHREIGGFGDALWLIIEGGDESEVADRLSKTEEALDQLVGEGVIASFALPTALWPRPDAQRSNREAAIWVSSRRIDALSSAAEAGFTPESLQMTEGFFEALHRFGAQSAPVWPRHPSVLWLFRQFAARSDDRLLALGTATAADGVGDQQLIRLSRRLESSSGCRMFGWSLLSTSLLGLLQRDLTRVVLPMVLILVLMLAFAFRRLTEIMLSFATLAFSLTCLCALMVLLGWSWNLMNVMALSLLFGAGVDYGIHIQLALQRHRGDVVRVGSTVGKAILLCGASTASGFGTLGLASNAGLASLGKVCAAGVMITALVSVFLLPVWWRSTAGRRPVDTEPDGGD